MRPVMILSFGYLILRLLQLIIVLAHGDGANVVEVLVLRHQVAVLHRQVRRLDLEPADPAVRPGLVARAARPGRAAVWPPARAALPARVMRSARPGRGSAASRTDSAAEVTCQTASWAPALSASVSGWTVGRSTIRSPGDDLDARRGGTTRPVVARILAAASRGCSAARRSVRYGSGRWND